MSEFRKNPVSGSWVIVAPERNLRPHDFAQRKKFQNLGSPETCPFCAGNESLTPPEVFALRPSHSPANTPGWEIRVVPNKFPILDKKEELIKGKTLFFERISGFGFHEVIIETPEHFKTVTRMSLDEVCKIFFTYLERIKHIKTDERIKYITIFKNHGEEAGASISHSHSQLMALPIIPPDKVQEMKNLRNYYTVRGKCLLCEIIKEELKKDERIVEKNDKFVAITPYASKFPYEVWIIPINHQSDFYEIKEGDIKDLAEIYRSILRKIETALDNPCFNMILHMRPFAKDGQEYFHWYIQVLPHLTRLAGLEWGSNIFVNITPPEKAAEILRRTQWRE